MACTVMRDRVLDICMQIVPKKTELLQIRIDAETKQALQKAARHSHMSASAFALIGIRELLREGETSIILPEHLRLTRSEKELRRQQAVIGMRQILRDMKKRQAQARANRRSEKPESQIR